VNRRQVLIGSGATGFLWTSAAGPWNIASAAPFGSAARVGFDGTVSTELGGVVNGTYQLHATSVTHHTVV
jgi:hypothetical protein